MISAELQRIIEDLKANKETLTELYLEGNNIGDDGARALADVLKENQILTGVNLAGNNIGDDGARALADALKENQALTDVNLRENKIGAEGAKALAGSLKVNKHLATLNLGGNKISNDGTRALANALKENQALTEIILWGNAIGDEGARALADVLKENQILTEVDVYCNKIGDEGAMALAAALKENQTLTELHLDSNKIGDEGTRALVDALKENQTLTRIKDADYRDEEDTGPIYDLLERNEKIAETVLSLKEAREMLSEDSLDAFNEKLRQVQEYLSLLENHPLIHKEYKKEFDVLVIDAYITVNNYMEAFAYYAENPTISDISAYQLAHFIYVRMGYASLASNEVKVADEDLTIPDFHFESSKEHAAATLALLKKSFLFEEAQGLIPEVVLRLFNKENSDSEKISSGQVLGVDKVVPLSFLEETLKGCFEKEEVAQEELANWMIISEYLNQLSPLQLYSVCQLSPLSKALKENIGTVSITTFEALLPNQREYPLKTQEKTETLLEIVRKITFDPNEVALDKLLQYAVVNQRDNAAESAASQANPAVNHGLFSRESSRKRTVPFRDSTDVLDVQPQVKKGKFERDTPKP